jgi:predicted amidophosphoribosyltransferase
MLLRTVPTAPQVRLSLEERRENVRTAFRVSDQWAPADHDRLLLVDDVRTSGATLNACVDALTAAGCGSVSALTFAIDLKPRELAAFIARERPRS